MKIAAAIFCGGNSERMCFPKAFLKKDDYTLLENAVNNYKQSGIEKIIVIINENLLNHSMSHVIRQISGRSEIILNKFPEKGRTYSINLAVKNINGSSNCFLQNIDNPVPDKGTLKEMVQLLSNENQFVVPQVDDKTGHPVLAGKAVMKYLSEKKGLKWNLRDELKKFQKVILHLEDKRLLFNLNTPSDWNTFITMKNH
jgi:CTP:molybdopterin cytidylyltransferase MocA